jgi:hypothetical protein
LGVVVSGAALPDADGVAGRVGGHGNPKVAFRVRGQDDLAACGGEPGQGLVYVLNVDVRDHACLACDGKVGHEVTDHMTGRVGEMVAVGVPAENGLVEVRRSADIRGSDAQIRYAAGPEYRDLRHAADSKRGPPNLTAGRWLPARRWAGG